MNKRTYWQRLTPDQRAEIEYQLGRVWEDSSLGAIEERLTTSQRKIREYVAANEARPLSSTGKD